MPLTEGFVQAIPAQPAKNHTQAAIFPAESSAFLPQKCAMRQFRYIDKFYI